MTRPASGTAATRALDRLGIAYESHTYEYLDRGGADHAARCMGVAAERVIKTLVLRTDAGTRIVVLMHGDRQVSMRALARGIGARRVSTCSPDEAFRATGYVVGGISPFGMKQPLPVHVEASVLELDRILINGGRRGLLLEIDAAVLPTALDPIVVQAAAPRAEE